MLSYMLPTTTTEEKSSSSTTTSSTVKTTTSTPRSFNLSLNLTEPGPGNPATLDAIDETTSLLVGGSGGVDDEEEQHPLLDASQGEVGCKNKSAPKTTMALKRVSFGSSMVETLVFEAPTPLPEHSEREFGFPDTTNGDDTDCPEELERSKVRVTFFQSSQPQCVSPPDQVLFGDTNNNSFIELNNNNNTGGDVDFADFQDDPDKMAAVVAHMHQQTHTVYDRQMSTESGWDNPFRPGGDLSREADEIVNLIKGGKPITPTEEEPTEHSELLMSNGMDNGATVVDGEATKVEAPQVNSAQNKSPQRTPTTATTATNGSGNGTSSSPQTQVVPGPQSASHVIIEDKKKKKCTCCTIQ